MGRVMGARSYRSLASSLLCSYNVITSGEAMKARLVRIGSSQGIRIPKLLREQEGLQDEVAIEVEGNRLVIFPLPQPRAGWDEAFEAMARQGDDALLDGG